MKTQPIKPAQQVRREMESTDEYRTGVSQEVDRVMRCIEFSKERGHTSATFTVSQQYGHEVRRLFEREGYTFRPIGYCGGVLQHGDRICW